MRRTWLLPGGIGFLLGAGLVGAGILLARIDFGVSGANSAPPPTLHFIVTGYNALDLDAKGSAAVGSDGILETGSHGVMLRQWTVRHDSWKEPGVVISATMTGSKDPLAADKSVTVLLFVDARKPIRLQLGEGIENATITLNDKAVAPDQLIDLGPPGLLNARIVITGQRTR